MEAAVQFARDIGVQDCIIEGDSLITYNALSGNTPPPSSVEAVISGIRVLSGFLRRVKFSHVRRQCNRPMHQLVRVVGFIVWLEENHKYKIILNIFHMVTCQTRMCQGF